VFFSKGDQDQNKRSILISYLNQKLSFDHCFALCVIALIDHTREDKRRSSWPENSWKIVVLSY